MTVAALAARAALLGVALTLTLTACTAAPKPRGPTVTTPTSSETPREHPALPAAPHAGARTTPVRVIGGGGGTTVLPATLWDNAATRSLLAQLPLTLTLKDFGHQEKVLTPPHLLSVDDMPTGADPDALDIGFYAPDGVLVFYYADVGYFTGIARLGHFDASIDTLIGLDDGTTVTIEVAQ